MARPDANNPILNGVRPSTSFIGEILDVVVNAFSFSGNGNCTKIPCTVLSLFSRSIRALSSCWENDDGSLWSLVSIPTSVQAFCLFFTYVAEAGLSPTSTVARHGLMFSLCNSATASFTLSFTEFATSVPSIFCPAKQVSSNLQDI